MTDEQRAALRALAEKATPGPWWAEPEYNAEEMGLAIIAVGVGAGSPPGNPTRGMVAWASEILPENAEQCEANGAYIAAAHPAAVIALLDECERLRGALVRAQERIECEDWQGECPCDKRNRGRCHCHEDHKDILSTIRAALSGGAA